MSDRKSHLPTRSGKAEVDAFLGRLATTPKRAASDRRGRLIFALDATASREPTWDQACRLQAEMFAASAGLGGLETQLCWYRGFGEFHSDDWSGDPDTLLRQMTGVFCLGGTTQIEKLLRHAIRETRSNKPDALVFVGDCVEENPDVLCKLAGELGVLGVPLFLFQEGHEPAAARAFAQMAKLSGGAHCRFDAGSAAQLRELLGAVAVYAAGGRQALTDFSRRHGDQIRRLSRQLGSR